MTRGTPTPSTPVSSRGLVLVGAAIVLTGFNLRTAVGSVGPVLEEVERGLDVSSGLAGLITSMPVLCFALIGFAGPPLAARFRDGHVLAAALLAMTLGLVGRVVVGNAGLFLVGTVAAMVGGALGNVMLPGLVKKWFPGRTGLMVGAYGAALSLGTALSSIVTPAVTDRAGADGWRWGLGLWAVFALVSALPWLFVPSRPGAAPGRRVAVPVRAMVRSRLAWAMALFFGLQSMEAYILVGWVAQYLRDEGMAASTAGLLVGLNGLIGIPLGALVPSGTVRQRWQRPMLAGFVVCYLIGWTGLLLSPLTAAWLWVSVLGVGMGSFPMILALFGLRGRTPDSVAALSTFAQGCGYALAGVGPLLVGLLRGVTGGYGGMFVLVYAGVLVLAVVGWSVTRERYVDDELLGLPGGVGGTGVEETEAGEIDVEEIEVEVAGTEPPVTVRAPRP